MPRRSIGEYPPNWQEIAYRVKDEAGWCCIRCGRPNNPDPRSGDLLTVHHLDMHKANCEWWNLAALCQRCHLMIQNKVDMQRAWMFEHSTWFKPYVAGTYAARLGMPTDRAYVMEHMSEIFRAWRMHEMGTPAANVNGVDHG